MDDNSNASPSGDDQDPPKYHSLVPVHTTDTSLASTIGKEASSLDVQDGENWLKLVLRDPSQERSVLDPSQDVSTPSIHPMMLSLQGLEGHMDDVPSHHTFLCFDVDGQHLIVKDMRERNNVDATDNDHWNAVLGRYESCTNTWSLQDLPRRQARLLYPHDRLYIGPLQRSSQDTTAWTLVLEHCYARTRPASPVPVAVVATHREQQAIENQHGGLLESQETYETDTGIEGTLTSASQTQTQSQDEFHGQNAAPWMLERLVGAQLLTQPGTQEDGPLSQEETDERGSKPSRSETGHREVASREDTKETQIIDDNKRNTQQSKQSNCPIGRKEEEDDDETVDPDEITGLKPETDPPETENAANVCENVTNAKSSTDDAAAKNIRFSAEKVMTSPKSQSLPNSASRLERVRPTHMQKASVEAQTDSFATRKEQSFISQVASAETVKPAELAKLSDTPETVQSPVREAPDTNLMAHSGTRGLQVEAEPLTVDESQAEIVNGALSNGSKLGHTPVNDKNCVDKETARELTAGSLSAAIAGGTSGNRSSFTSPDKSCNSVALMSPAQSSGQRSCMSPESVSVLSVINTPGSVPQSKSRGLIKSLISTIEARQPSQETQSKDVFTCEDAEVNIKSTTSERDDDRTEMSPMIDRADEKKIGDVGCETARAEKPAKSLTSETHNPGTNGDIENDETIEESRTRKRPLRKSRRLSDTSTEENESPANITRSVRKKLKTTPALSVKRSNRMDTKEPVRVAVTTIELTTKQRNVSEAKVLVSLCCLALQKRSYF